MLEGEGVSKRLLKNFYQFIINFVWDRIFICVKEISRICERLYDRTRFLRKTVLLVFILLPHLSSFKDKDK